MNANIQAAITRAWEDGVTARRTQGNRTILPTPHLGARTFQVLVRADGQVTREGAYYNQLSGEADGDRRFDPNQPVSRRGNTEYIRDRSGREVALRTLQPNGDWANTRAGLTYFERARAEVIVQIPIIIQGTRSNGHPYERRDWLPAEDAGVGRIMVDGRLSLRQREARAKQLVSAQLSDPIMELSGETFRLDPQGEWFYNEMRTDPGPDGPVVTTAFHRPMGHLRRAMDFIPHADLCLESAWDQTDDRLCVIRQLAELLSESFEDLCADFDGRIENWHPRGITSEELGQWCTDRGLPWKCLADGRVTQETPEEPQGPCVCWCVWSEHCYMYKKPVEFTNGKLQPRLRGETVSDVPPVSEWLQWDGEVRVGTFFHSDLAL